MSNVHWSYLDSSKERQGPFTKSELLKLVGDGAVSAQTFVWRSGMADWQKMADVVELQAASAPSTVEPVEHDSANLLTRRLSSSQGASPVRGAGNGGSGVFGFLKVAAAVLLLAGLVWANRAFCILPGSDSVVESEQTDRWFSADNREGAIIQCTIDRKGAGKSGGVRYRLTATVSAGVARGRRLPVDRAGSSQVVIRDADGREVFNQLVSNAKLCPS